MDPLQYMRAPFPPVPRQTQALSSTTFNIPPLDGSLTLPQMVDWHAEHSPQHTVFEYAEADGTVVAVKFPELMCAMHRGARVVLSGMPKSGFDGKKKRPLVAIVANSDTLTYFTMNLAVSRAGVAVFPISPRNSPIAVAHLLKKAEVDHVLVGQEPAMQELAAAAFNILNENKDLLPSTSSMPVYEDLYFQPDEQWMPLPPMEPHDIKDTSIVLHSSGSTAFPKPIHWAHFTHLVAGRWPHYHERDLTGMRVSCHAVPMFHGMGAAATCWALMVGVTITAFKPQLPARAPAPEGVLKGAMQTNSDLLFSVPAMIEEWCKIPEQVDWIVQRQGVLYGGGPLAKEVGDMLASRGLDIFTLYGTTEYGMINFTLPKKGNGVDWEYFEFSPVCNVHFTPLGDGNSQVVLVANEYQVPVLMNCLIDGVGACDTNDIAEPHPTRKGFWKIVGRADDQIMHSTGEKTNPAPLEPMLNQDPHISSAVMFGRGKFQPGVLIDPKPEFRFESTDHTKLAAFRNAIWPTIEKVNAYAPQHSRIFKEVRQLLLMIGLNRPDQFMTKMIIVSSPSKPFTYTAKGTPRRAAIVKEYDPEIEDLYTAVEETTQAHLPPPTSWTLTNATNFVRSVVSQVLSGKSIKDNDDLFQHGCDSLQATWIRNSLLHALRETTQSNTRSIPNNFIYQHPSIGALAKFLLGLGDRAQQVLAAPSVDEYIAAMHAMVEKYSKDFPKHVPKRGGTQRDVVFVTGTTGAMGAALLAALVDDPQVQQVYAVNRRSETSLEKRQKQVLVDRGYDAERILQSKVVLIEADMEADRFGLEPELYDEIRDSVTHILHNAWPVNFNFLLNSFEGSVAGLRQLVDLSLSSPNPSPPPVCFVSSVGVLRNLNTQPVPEAPVSASAAVGSGYSESKWVCETILNRANESTRRSGAPLRTIAVRLGQITGTSGNGAWSTAEYLPSLVKSSAYLGCFPEIKGVVSWIPVDCAARAMLEMLRSPGSTFSTYHLAHPRPVPWNTLFHPVSDSLSLMPVSYSMWLHRLKKSAEWFADSTADREVEQTKANPALKILDFFEGANTNSRDLARKCSLQHGDGDLLRTKGSGIVEVDGPSEPSEGKEAFGIPQLSFTEAERVAPSLGPEALPQLTADDAMRWGNYWMSIGFLR